MDAPSFTRKSASKTVKFGAIAASLALLTSGCSGGGAESTVPDDCQPSAEVETLHKGKLTVLVAEHPPFVTTENGELTGIEGELIKKIAADLCLEVDSSTTSFSAIIEGLQSGRADLSAGNWTVNDERREIFEVSNGLYEGGMGVVSRGDDLETVDDLKDKSLGTPQGYLWIDQLHDLYGKSAVREYQSDSAVLDDVKAKRIDVGVVSILANTWRLTQDQYSDLKIDKMQKSPDMPYTQEPPLSVALIKKGNTALKGATDQTIADYKDSGELDKSFEKYGLDPSLVTPNDKDSK
ncbi:ABC transporter substrate-binding protein [Brevibacterium aurantiacum]|uniref:Amino acid ABC transporter substrate-binding protein n=1 Tax=Brevibacterium aurantiacum TaxID=273384 RepID=A0A556C936_BREAU|nr:ABC transporter substrate-binding protein [Brevibacterium aurantiacum]TSI13965.1 amino acid ABC transporter substrate-binding protein [Brevibacterium aurantiacum]